MVRKRFFNLVVLAAAVVRRRGRKRFGGAVSRRVREEASSDSPFGSWAPRENRRIHSVNVRFLYGCEFRTRVFVDRVWPLCVRYIA